MENQTNIVGQDTQQIEQNPVNQPTISPISEKQKLNYWMISTIVLIVILIVGGAFYFLNGKRNLILTSNQNLRQSAPTNVPSTVDLLASPVMTKSNQLISVSGLRLTYPESWIPVFASNNYKNLVYFAKTEQDAQSLADCAMQGPCSDYPLKLEGLDVYYAWQGLAVGDFIEFIKRERPDIQLSSLQKATIGGHEAWLGYTNPQKTSHQAVIVMNTGRSRLKGSSQEYVAITASTTNATSGMLEEYIAKLLPTVEVNDEYDKYEPFRTGGLKVKKGFVVELTSSLNTKDLGLVNFILYSLLAPKNSTNYFSYLLYVESTKSSGSSILSIGGPNFPKDNFLNGKYFLLTDNDQLNDGMYGTTQVQIKLSTSPIKDLGQYLADPKYCEQDSDCQYRANYCEIDAFNFYHQFTTPESGGSATGSSFFECFDEREKLREKLGCRTWADIEFKYDYLKCVNNSCQAVNAKAFCKQ